jgi:hypothetical protein
MVGKVSLDKLQAWSRIDGVGIILAPNATLEPKPATIADAELALV